MVRIKSIGIKQTAKVFAVFYFIVSLTFALPIAGVMMLVGSLSGDDLGFFGAAFGGAFLLLIPLFYAGVGFLMVALTSFMYNQIAKRVGGVEIELDSEVIAQKKDPKKS